MIPSWTEAKMETAWQRDCASHGAAGAWEGCPVPAVTSRQGLGYGLGGQLGFRVSGPPPCNSGIVGT